MPVPAEVMFDILQLGLATSDLHTLRRCACLVLCYCWYNRADSGVLLLRRHVTFDVRGITVYFHVIVKHMTVSAGNVTPSSTNLYWRG